MQYRIGTCTIDCASYEVRHDGQRVPVEPQVFDLLIMLIENRDRVVTKDDILERIWKGRIVSEAALNSRMRAARQALGDNGAAQRFIRTVRGRGFRFVGDVTEEHPPAVKAQPGPVRPAGAGAAVAPIRDRIRHSADRPGLAVMPFDNLSGPADEYFVDGVVEEITSALSRAREFPVIARQSAFMYKGRSADVREVGRELGAAYVVQGALRRSCDRLRISVQLVDTETRAQLWSDNYEGHATDIFDLQDRIASQVAGAVHPAVRKTEIEIARRTPPGKLSARDLVMRAYPMLWAGNGAANRQAIAFLREAVARDGGCGRARALLAWCHAQEVAYDWSPDAGQDRTCALGLVEGTAGLIDDDPAALTAAGAALSQCLADQTAAAARIERALRLDPNNAWAWARYGWVAVFSEDGRCANARFERALEISPLDPLAFNITAGRAAAHMLEGKWAEAARLFGEITVKHPEATRVYRGVAACAALAGDLETAKRAARKLQALRPDVSVTMIAGNHPMRHIDRVITPFLDGLKHAGVPEGC